MQIGMRSVLGNRGSFRANKLENIRVGMFRGMLEFRQWYLTCERHPSCLAPCELSSLPPVEMARLSNASARMIQVYQEGLLTLQKLRTGGKQTVVVQHVQVGEGGQAVIAGNMKAGGRKCREGVDSKNGENTP